jgi:spore coat protein A
MTTRRSVLGQLGALTAAATGALAPWRLAWSQAAPKLLDGRSVLKFQSMLPNPLAPEFLAAPDSRGGSGYTLYIREVQQWLGLATSAGPLPPTTVWGYGTATRPATYPGPTFDVPRGRKLRVTFVNSLVDAAGNPLPNRMPVDTTLEWANPGAFGGVVPVPAATHLHGGDNDYLSDGLPDAWSTPVGQVGRLYQRDYTYDNDQEAGFLWYHDHALGITRTNVYMGLAGLYFLRDEQENALRAANVLPSYPFEVPLVIQDRQFAADASLHYPATGKGMPTPTHLPEFFGDVLLVNTQAWPRLAVEQRKYRFRLLNGSDSRFYDLRVVTPRGAKLPLLVVGNELGLLDGPVTPDLGGEPDVLPIAPGERYDVVIDFAAVPAGTRLVMTNSARSPYPNGSRVVNGVTDAVMAFDVVPAGSAANASVGPGTVLRGEPLPPAAVPAGATPHPDVRGGRRLRPPEDDARSGGLGRRPAGHAELPGPDHRKAHRRQHRGLGVLQRHRRRAPAAHAPGRLPHRRPPGVHRHRRAEGDGRRDPGRHPRPRQHPLRRAAAPAAPARGGPQGHRDRLSRRGRSRGGDVPPRGRVRVPLPHPLARGPRDDAALRGGQGTTHPVRGCNAGVASSAKRTR